MYSLIYVWHDAYDTFVQIYLKSINSVFDLISSFARARLFPESAVRNIMFQILQGLTFIHKHGASYVGVLSNHLFLCAFSTLMLNLLYAPGLTIQCGLCRILPQRYEAWEPPVHRTRAGEDSRLWAGSGDQISPSVHRLCLYQMVSLLFPVFQQEQDLILYCALVGAALSQWGTLFLCKDILVL